MTKMTHARTGPCAGPSLPRSSSSSRSSCHALAELWVRAGDTEEHGGTRRTQRKGRTHQWFFRSPLCPLCPSVPLCVSCSYQAAGRASAPRRNRRRGLAGAAVGALRRATEHEHALQAAQEGAVEVRRAQQPPARGAHAAVHRVEARAALVARRHGLGTLEYRHRRRPREPERGGAEPSSRTARAGGGAGSRGKIAGGAQRARRRSWRRRCETSCASRHRPST